MPTTLEGIPGSLRAGRYRQFAAETLKLARSADGSELKATYLSLAACWKRLAERADTFANEDDEDG